MTFLNPLGFLFLLAAIPVLALHLLKPRRAEVKISSAMLWDADTVGATAASPWQKIPPTMLLFLQLLLVGLGALALANPSVVRGTSLAEHTVVVLDTSASMAAIDGSPDRFEDARTSALSLLDELPSGGRVSLVTAGPTPRVRLTATTDFDAFAGTLAAVRLSDGPSDLQAAMTLADGLETADAQLGIVLISDGGHSDAELAALPTGVTHRIVGTSDINHSITSLQVVRVDGGLQITAVSEVTGGGEVSAPLRFDVDDVTRAVVDITIEPGQPTTTEVVLPDGDEVVARLGGDDLLAIDNTAYALTRSRSEVAISIEGEPDPFTNALLEVLPGVEVVDASVDTPELTIFVGVPVPDDITRPFLAINSPGGAPGITEVGEVESPAVTLVRSADPLLNGLDLSRLRIVSAQQIEAPTGEVLFAAEGAPLLVRGSTGGVPFLYLAFDPSESTLPVELAFPVLGSRMIEELSGAVTVPASLEVGDPINPPAGRAVTVVAPNGTVMERAAGSGAVVSDRPGFWTVTPVDGVTRTIAVSLPASESRIDPLPVAPTDPRPVRPGEDPPEATTSWRWVVILVALGVGFLEWLSARRSRGVPGWQWRTASILRIASVALLVGALLGASIPLSSDQIATVFVLDRSDSVGRLGEVQGLNAAQLAADSAPSNGELGVVVSADGARIEQLLIPAEDSTGLSSSTIDGGRSDLASGLRLAGALLPDDAQRRVVVVSDGRATSGDAEAEAAILGGRGIPVDYVLVDSVSGEDAAVLGVNAPATVDQGAQIPIEVIVESSTEQPGRVTLRRDGEVFASQDVLLAEGNNELTFAVEPTETGLVNFTATVDTPDDFRAENNTARTTVDIDGPAEVLVVEGTPNAGDLLATALESSGLVVDVVAATSVPALDELVGYDSTVLVDVSADQLTDSQMASLVTATRQLGRGLVTIGGPQSFGTGGYRESELEEVLPVISDVLDPQRQRQVAQVMALDTSESMGECHCADGFEAPAGDAGGVNKTEIARAGAARAIANLNSNDEVGVLAVDTSERWLIDLQQLPPEDVINSGLSEAVPSGNTDLSDTLPTAADALIESNAALKHIILFTDGFTSDASLRAMRNQAEDIRAEGITISVVATGEGAARELAAIAEAGGGRFYPGRDLTRIPEILVQESILASRNFINEGEFLPVVTDTSPVVDSLVESPPLLGFTATTSKPTARTLLRIGPEQDPLLATWQVGFGRSTSWTSDANSRWSQFWVDWAGYSEFWSTVVRDTFPVTSSGSVRTIVDGDSLTVRAEADSGAGRVNAQVTSPDGSTTEVRLREVAPGIFEGTTTADGAGTYAVGVSGGDADDTIGAALASVSYAAEYQPGNADEALLARLSEASGGRGAITASEAFDPEGLVAGRRSVPLAAWFLWAGVISWLLAVIFSRLLLSGRREALAAPVRTPRPERTERPKRDRRWPSRHGAGSGNTGVPESESPPAKTEEPSPTAPPSTPAPASSATIQELLETRRRKERGE